MGSTGRPPIISISRDLIERSQNPEPGGRWYRIVLAGLIVVAIVVGALLLFYPA